MRIAIPYTMTIGVTGHRELADPSAVENEVTRVLQHIDSVLCDASAEPRGQCGTGDPLSRRCNRWLIHALNIFWRDIPTSDKTPSMERRTPVHWRVISALALGADRIVAKSVLSQPDAKLEVIVPLELEVYRRDFSTEADKNEFDQLIDQAGGPQKVLLPPDFHTQRHEGYRWAGERVVDGCEILIAVWDQVKTDGVGTGATLRYALEEGTKIIWVDANKPKDSAVWLSLPAEGGEWDGKLSSLEVLPLPCNAKDLSENFHQLSAYNRDNTLSHADLETARETCFSKLNKDYISKTTLPVEHARQMMSGFLTHYCRADHLAIRYQSLYERAAKWTHYLAAIAVTIVVAQTLFLPDQNKLVAFEFLAMLAALVLMKLGETEAWHEKWLHDRHLAERLRSAMFSSAQGIQTRPDTRTHTLLPHYHGLDDWVFDAYCYIVGKARSETPHIDDLDTNAVKHFLTLAWIEDQHRYHKGNAVRKRKSAHNTYQLGIALFGITMIMAIMHYFEVGHSVKHAGDIITFLAIVLPAWGAAIFGIQHLLDHERIADRSGRMAFILARIKRSAEQAENDAAFAAAISRAQEIMDSENQEWRISLSYKELELPT